MNILAIGAHPDDIEYGCGGTLLKLRQHEEMLINFFVATDGRYAGGEEVRRKEQEDALAFLGGNTLYWGGFIDTQLEMGRPLISKIEDAVKDCNPEVIFVNYPRDDHQDHRALAEATIVASRYCKKVLFYEDYTAVNFSPDIYVDIEEVLDRKVELLKVHRSQVERDYPTGLDIVESTKAVANFRGFQAKVKYAEGFKSLRYLLDNI